MPNQLRFYSWILTQRSYQWRTGLLMQDLLHDLGSFEFGRVWKVGTSPNLQFKFVNSPQRTSRFKPREISRKSPCHDGFCRWISRWRRSKLLQLGFANFLWSKDVGPMSVRSTTSWSYLIEGNRFAAQHFADVEKVRKNAHENSLKAGLSFVMKKWSWLGCSGPLLQSRSEWFKFKWDNSIRMCSFPIC